jgi:rubrerythrin
VAAKTGDRFSDTEAVKLAQGMEREGLAFYRAAGRAAGHGQLADTFAMLEGEEEKHLNTFDNMAAELAAGKTEDYWDEPDIDAYIQAAISQKIFPRPELAPAQAKNMSGAGDALRFALQAEKDTVLFYTLCAERARGGSVRQVFCRLVTEEMRHVVLIGRLLRGAGG